MAVFTGTPRDGHGHHQVSGVLAREAFDAAADTVRFPRVDASAGWPWAPAKFYRLRRGGRRHADVQRRRVRSAARREVRRDRVGEPVAASVAGVGRAAAARDAVSAACSSRRRVSPIRKRRRRRCSTASTRRGRDSSRCRSPTRCAARSIRCVAAQAAVVRVARSRRIRRAWSRRSPTYAAARDARGERRHVRTLDAMRRADPTCDRADRRLALALSTTQTRAPTRCSMRRACGRGDRAARAGRGARHPARHGHRVQPGQGDVALEGASLIGQPGSASSQSRTIQPDSSAR